MGKSGAAGGEALLLGRCEAIHSERSRHRTQGSFLAVMGEAMQVEVRKDDGQEWQIRHETEKGKWAWCGLQRVREASLGEWNGSRVWDGELWCLTADGRRGRGWMGGERYREGRERISNAEGTGGESGQSHASNLNQWSPSIDSSTRPSVGRRQRHAVR